MDVFEKKVQPVSGDSDKPVVVGNAVGKKHKVSKRILVITVILLAGAGGTALYYSINRSSISTEKVHELVEVCNDNEPNSIVQQSETILVAAKKEELKLIVQKIENLDKYDQDPNCLYIVITYYVNINDPSNARKYYDKIAVLNSQEYISQRLLLSGGDITSLEQKVKFLEWKLNPDNRNFTGIEYQEGVVEQ